MYIHLVVLLVNFRVVCQLIHQYLRAYRGVGSHSIMVVVAAPCKVLASPLRDNLVLASPTIDGASPGYIFVSYAYTVVPLVRVGVS